jgi:uncharacterized protein YcbX
MHLSEAYVHPVKSCAGMALEALDIEPRGPRHDRRWMVVEAGGRFVTGRRLPRMVLIRPRPQADGLVLAAPGMPELGIALPGPGAPRLEVEVWGDRVEAQLAGGEADRWLSRFLGFELRLVHMDDAARRAVDPARARAGDEVSFADGYPLLLIGQASLDGLNARLAAPLPMTRFRPNLVVAGAEPHAEDRWRRIRIGAIAFEVVKPCTRCVFTTVDSAGGFFDPSGEPLATLKTYRRGERGITFGMNLIARGRGTIRVGDRVEVID